MALVSRNDAVATDESRRLGQYPNNELSSLTRKTARKSKEP